MFRGSRGSTCRAPHPAAPAEPGRTTQTQGPWSGLGPDTGNWAVGFTVTFPLMDFAALRARRDIGSGNERTGDRPRLEQINVGVEGAMERARASLGGARRRRRRTRRSQIAAARDAAQQATRATRPASARSPKWPKPNACSHRPKSTTPWRGSTVWRALLGVAAAQGDSRPFLAEEQVAEPMRLVLAALRRPSPSSSR